MCRTDDNAYCCTIKCKHTPETAQRNEIQKTGQLLTQEFKKLAALTETLGYSENWKVMIRRHAHKKLACVCCKLELDCIEASCTA